MNRSRASFNVQESFIADSLVLFLIWHSGARGIKLQEINGDWLIGSSTCNNAAGRQLIWCHPGHYRSDVCSASKGPSLQCRSSTVGWYWLNTGCTRRCTVAKTVGNWALPTLHSTVLQLPQSYHIVSDTIHISNIYIISDIGKWALPTLHSSTVPPSSIILRSGLVREHFEV